MLEEGGIEKREGRLGRFEGISVCDGWGSGDGGEESEEGGSGWGIAGARSRGAIGTIRWPRGRSSEMPSEGVCV